jgi:hypothetical protein
VRSGTQPVLDVTNTSLSSYPSSFHELSSTLRQRPSINENIAFKSKIATPKGPEAFRRDPSLRCAMKVGSLELGNLWATKSRQGKYEERKERGGNGGFI